MKLRLLLVAAVVLPVARASAAPGCTLTLAGITFGNYDVFNPGNLTWSGTLSYVCTGGANGPIIIDLGTGSSGAYAQRRLASGANGLNYNLYTDALFSTIWGDGNTGTGEYFSSANPANGATNLVPVFGSIPALQDAAVGSYSDTITATIYWTRKQVTNSSTISVAVSATVIAKCTISTSPVQFGDYDPVVANAAAPKTTAGAVNTSCTRGAAVTIGLDAGLNPVGAQRRLAGAGGGFLNYQLYQDPAHAVVWGNSGAALLSPAPAPAAAPRSFAVYAEIPGGQDPLAGAYNDTVIATITY